MCGIAGWFHWHISREEREARLRAMCDSIRHRGPDDAGYFFANDVALGMRRLSIVDLEGGRQPMTSDGGRLTLVMNGEIYNHAALRTRLRDEGQIFRTRSDTEVLLALFERQGAEGLVACNGMFAAAVWNAENRKLTLVRDRMGVKPLYYYYDGRKFLFASEIKALLAARAFTPELNPVAVWHYLTFRYVPGPDCIWKHVHKLPPGHILEYDGHGDPKVTRWWDIPYPERSRDVPEPQLDSEFAALMDDAVQLRMLADVPVGILLSGGLDSSVVAALAQRHAARPVKTYSVAFDGAKALDERPYARLVARHLGTDHREVVISRKDFQDFLPRFPYFTDEPLADLASIPLHHVCRLAAGDVKVVLSGEGSDEILAGYTFEVWAERWSRRPRRRGWRRINDALFPLPLEDMRDWPQPLNMTNFLSSEEKRAMLPDAESFPDSFDGLRAHLRRLGRRHPLHQALYLYCQDWLVEDLLMKADRMSMAVSLELRTPFLDWRLVERAARMPPEQKAGRNAAGQWENKRILRRLAATLLPNAIVARPKMGFPVPVYDWLGREMKDFAFDHLGSGGRLRTLLAPHAVEAALARGTAPQAGMEERHVLWHLLILELWMRTWNI